MQKIIDRYGEEDDLNVKLILAHALAQSRRPEATEMLQGIVLDRNNAFMERRVAIHGLAFVDDPELAPALHRPVQIARIVYIVFVHRLVAPLIRTPRRAAAP